MKRDLKKKSLILWIIIVVVIILVTGAFIYSYLVSRNPTGMSVYRPYCYSKTCSELGKQCGKWDNGCRNLLNCGTCLGWQTCDSNGICQSKCTDTDNGLNYYATGTVKLGETSETDFCTGNDLTEYYCSSGNVYYRTYSCINCTDGACIKPICLDSDNGLNYYYVKGSVTLKVGNVVYDSKKDICINSSLLTEYYCLNDSFAYRNYGCKCSDGTCIN